MRCMPLLLLKIKDACPGCPEPVRLWGHDARLRTLTWSAPALFPHDTLRCGFCSQSQGSEPRVLPRPYVLPLLTLLECLEAARILAEWKSSCKMFGIALI